MSEKSTDIVAGLVTRQGKNGRRSYSVPAKQALAMLCSQPGVSVARTALMHGVNANLLRRWMVLYGPGGRPANEAGTSVSLVPVSTGSAATLRASSPPDCIEINFHRSRRPRDFFYVEMDDYLKELQAKGERR